MGNNSDIQVPQGANFAPMKPLLDLKDNLKDKEVADHELSKQLREKYSDLINRDKEARREMVRIGKINALFIQGEQVLKINSFDGMPRIVPVNKRDPKHLLYVNKMQYYSTNWQNKWRSSKPDVLVEPYSNADQAIAQAKKANTVVDYLENSFYNNWFDLHEGLNAQIWGWYGRRVKPDYTAKSFSAFKEIVSDVETPIGKGWGRCECGYRGNEVKKVEDLSLCPKCGSESYKYEPPVIQLIPKVTGKEKIFLPEIICESLLFPAVCFDISKRAEESPYFITERRIEEAALRRILGKIRFPEGESENDFGLDAIDTLARRGAAFNGLSETSEEKKGNKVTLTEMYLSADELYDIRIGKEGKTVEGGILPKGKRMSDVFPEGCLVIGTNGMSLILGIYADHHSDCISSGVYHMKSMSGTGRGIEDAVPINRQFNKRYSQIDNIFGTRSSPATLFAENLIAPKYRKLLNKPGADIPVNMSQLPDNMRGIGDAIYPLQAGDVPSGLMETTFNNLESMLQVAYHITDFAGGNPRVKNDTATGARILDANADALFSPTLALKADVTVDTVKKGFYKWIKFTPLARFLPFKTKPKSGAVGIEISGKDVDGEYRWSYVEGSEAPKNKFSEMEKKVNFFAQFGGATGWAQAKAQFPKEVSQIERDFDVDFAGESYDATSESCRIRYENAKKQIKDNQPNFLEVFFNLEPSLEITEPNLEAKRQWFQELLDSEEGLRAPTIERKLIAAFVVAFTMLAKGQTIEVQRQQAEVEIASNQPVVEEQNNQQAQQMEVQNQQQQMQAEQQRAEQEQALTVGAVEKAVDLEEAERQRAHEVQLQTQQNLTDAAVADAQNQGA